MKKMYIIFSLLFVLNITFGQQWAVEGVQLKNAVIDGRVDSVWHGVNLPNGFSGKDVIVGITDWGFDFTHPVFYDTLMNDYRILRVWDQSKKSGPAPEGFSLGTEIVGKDALLSAQSDTANVYSYHYHGTHVASIAAGAGAGTAYRGVAYDANLILVSILVDENAVADAFRWMYKVSQEEQKRLVVNMSWGLYYFDNMDGTGKISELIDSLTNLGVIFVSSAGNNGDVDFHISHLFSGTSDTLKTRINYASGSVDQWGESISMLSSPNSSFSFALQFLNMTNNTILSTSPFYNTNFGDREIDTCIVISGTDTLFYKAIIEKSNIYNQRPQVRLLVKKFTGSYKLGLIATAMEGDFHAWNLIELTTGVGNWGGTFTASGVQGWVNGDRYYGIGAPSNIPSIISIAAHRSKIVTPIGTTGGNIASFSSWGPTFDGSIKPEISAPGYSVTAAISSFTDIFSGSYSSTTVVFNGKTYKFAALSGTSMSSPFVAGVVALMLEANPYLSAFQVKNILTTTAYQDQYTEQSGVVRFGYGKVDAYQAVIKALNTVGIESHPVDIPKISIYPNPASETIYVTIQADDQNFNLELYDLFGRLLKKQNATFGVNQIDISNLSAGYYIIKVSNKSQKWTYKIIKS